MGSSRRKSKPTLSALRREIVAQLNAAISDTGAIAHAMDANIHRVRRRTKRIRAQLQMLACVAPRKSRKASKHARDASALLSPFRDSQIVPAALEAVRVMLRDTLARDATVLAWLASIDGHHDAADPPLAESQRLALNHFRKSRRLIRKADLGRTVRMSAAHLAPAYDQGRESVRRVLRVGDEDSFHELRKAIKCHLYQCRFMKPICREVLEPRMELTERVGDLLGEVQDIAVLQNRCRMAPETIDQHEIELFLELCDCAAMGRRTDALAMASQLYFLTTPEFVKQLKSG